MAIAFDAASNTGDWGANSTNTHDLAHTCTGANRFLVVGVVEYSDSGVRTVADVTYNGIGMTKANGITATVESANQLTELWYRDGPATGSNTVQVTYSDTRRFSAVLAASYTGKTSVGIDAHNATQNTSASASSPTCNVNVVANDCWLVGVAFSRNGVVSAGTATTKRTGNNTGHAIGDSNGVVGTGNQTLAYTSSSETWPGVVSLSFSETGGGTNVTSNPTSASAAGAAGTLTVTISTPQLLSPMQDITKGQWLPSGGSPAELYSMIDESVASDSDYDYTTGPSTMEVRFAPGSDPQVSTGHKVRYRLKGSGSADAVVTLKEGAATIASWTETNVPTAVTAYEHTLSAGEANSITDYTNLRLSVEAA